MDSDENKRNRNEKKKLKEVTESQDCLSTKKINSERDEVSYLNYLLT